MPPDNRRCKTLQHSLFVAFIALFFISDAEAALKHQLHDTNISEMPAVIVSGNQLTQQGLHYKIQFGAADRFVFVIHETQMEAWNQPFYGDGAIRFWHIPESTSDAVSFYLPKKLVKMRNAFVAADRYFRNIADAEGIELRWWEPDKPIEVIIADPLLLETGVNGQAWFWNQKLTVTPTISIEKIHALAVHEYFHLFYHASWFTGDKDGFWRLYKKQSKNPFHKFVLEMTAVWATDEPIVIDDLPTGYTNQDEDNEYLSMVAKPFFLPLNFQSFFQHNPYGANLFIKYFAEQMAGGQDTSAAAEILKMIRKFYLEKDGINEITFMPSFAEVLPEGRFPGAGWQEKWQRFFSAFSVSNFVQNAKTSTGPGFPAGYHDDAFTKNEEAIPGILQEVYSGPFIQPPAMIYPEPAGTDEERGLRMEGLLKNETKVAPLAYTLINIFLDYLVYPSVPAHPVYFYAKGVEESDVFLVDHSYPREKSLWNRQESQLKRIGSFSFLNQGGPQRSALGIVEDFDFSNSWRAIWMGLVNTGPEHVERTFRWAYLVSPRLIPFNHFRGSRTVKLADGTALDHDENQGWHNGDTFTLHIRSTSPLHQLGANLSDISPQELSVKFKILTEDGHEVILDQSPGLKVGCTHEWSKNQPYYNYLFSGKIAETNPYTGKAYARFELTSPLNMGGEDRQIDETLKFELRPVLPRVMSFAVAQPESQSSRVIYDSETGLRKIAEPESGSYPLGIKVKFSMPMETQGLTLTAGRDAPYNQYRINRLACQDDNTVCTGKFEIPKADVPASGVTLRFSVSGKSERGGVIDADITLAGDQPDTSHFILLGIDLYYDVALTAQSQQERSHAAGNWRRSNFGPFRARLRLMPRTSDFDGRPNGLVATLESVLTSIQMMDQHLMTQAEKIKKDPSKREIYERYVKTHEFVRVQWPLAEAFLRVLAGIREYGYNPELSGPVRMDPASGTVEGAGKVGSYFEAGPCVETSIHASFSAASEADIARAGIGERLEDIRLKTWHVDGQDYEKALRLLENMRNLPADLDPVIADLFHLGMRDVFRQAAPEFWSFYPFRQRPQEIQEGGGYGADPELPHVDYERLVSFSGFTRIFNGVLVKGQGVHSGYHSKTQEACSEDFNSTFRIQWWGDGTFPGLLDVEQLRYRIEPGSGTETLVGSGESHGPIQWHMHESSTRQQYGFGPIYDDKDHVEMNLFSQDNNEDVIYGSVKATDMDTNEGDVYYSEYVDGRYQEDRGTVNTRRDWIFGWRVDRVGEIGRYVPNVAAMPDASEQGNREAEWVTLQPLPVPQPQAPPVPVEPSSSARGYDPRTGRTTESVRNPDGSHTVIVTDKQGSVISEQRTPPPGRRLPSASSYDRKTGITTTSQRNADGTVTIRRADKSGNVLMEKTIRR